MTRASLVVVLMLCACTPQRAGDPVQGEQRHSACLQCHGTEVYVPPRRKVASLADLRHETQRWADMYNPKLSETEIEDLVAYLNRDFYKFP